LALFVYLILFRLEQIDYLMQPVLEKLGLSEVNDGVFDAEWRVFAALIVLGFSIALVFA
jgi:hypothetical protein